MMMAGTVVARTGAPVAGAAVARTPVTRIVVARAAMAGAVVARTLVTRAPVSRAVVTRTVMTRAPVSRAARGVPARRALLRKGEEQADEAHVGWVLCGGTKSDDEEAVGGMSWLAFDVLAILCRRLDEGFYIPKELHGDCCF